MPRWSAATTSVTAVTYPGAFDVFRGIIAATAAHERGVRRLGDKCVRRRRLRGKRPGLPGPSRGVSRRDRRRARVVVRAPHDVRGAASAGATPACVRPIGRCTFVASFGEVPLPPSQLSLSPTLAASSTPARPLPSIPRRAAPNPTRSAPWPRTLVKALRSAASCPSCATRCCACSPWRRVEVRRLRLPHQPCPPHRS